MNVIDAVIDGVSLVYDCHCLINAIYISPLVKKQYLVDMAASDGTKDLSTWFGAPRFESRTLTIYAQCMEGTAADCADRFSNTLVGDVVSVELSLDPGLFRTGMFLQARPSSGDGSNVLQITILCDPYRYRMDEVIHEIPASDEAISYTWCNNGKQTVIPSVQVTGEAAVILCGTSRYNLTNGEFLLADLAIEGNSETTVEITGGPLEVRYREAVL